MEGHRAETGCCLERPRHQIGVQVPLGRDQPGGGDAPARSGRGSHSYDALFPGMGGGRRVQRGAWIASMLRPAHGHRHRPLRQPGGASHRGSNAPGRRRSDPFALDGPRRRRTRRAQRSQLHRAGIRASRRGRLLGPSPQPVSQMQPNDVDWASAAMRMGAAAHTGGVR